MMDVMYHVMDVQILVLVLVLLQLVKVVVEQHVKMCCARVLQGIHQYNLIFGDKYVIW